MLYVAGQAVDQTRLAALCEQYGVGRLLVFGSAARGDMSPGSDVDVLYELLPGRRLGWEIEQFANELSEIIGRPVDLVSVSALHRRLQPSVLAEAQPLYAT
jgi:predicted nucleotidyltransferase